MLTKLFNQIKTILQDDKGYDSKTTIRVLDSVGYFPVFPMRTPNPSPCQSPRSTSPNPSRKIKNIT